MACTHELHKGNLDNVYSYVRLSKIRCIGDKYVDFICQKYDTTWTITEARKHVLHMFENPEVALITKYEGLLHLIIFYLIFLRKISRLMLSRQL